MKIQKRIFSILLVFILFGMLNFANAELVNSKTHSSLYEAGSSKCDGGTFDQVMYAGSSKHEMVDTFKESNTSYVWEFDSDETYYSVYNNLPNALTIPTLAYFSQGKPHNIGTVVVMGTKDGATVTSSIPSTYKRSQVAAQVVYHVSRFGLLHQDGDDNSIEYLDFNKTSLGTQIYKYSFDFDAEILSHEDSECLNIHIGFCGDGVLDNNISAPNYSTDLGAKLNGGEKCDPKDTNKEGWGEMGCSSSCEPLDAVCGDGTKSKSEKCDPKDTNKEGWGDLGCSTSCEPLSLPDPKCGDGTLNGTEKCDPKDTNKEGWGEMGCSSSCEPLDAVCGDGTKSKSEECDPKDTNKEGWGDLGCSESCKKETEVIVKMKEKELLENRIYSVGDKIGFKVTFENNSDGTIYNVVVKDLFPRSLKFESAKIFGVEGVKIVNYLDEQYQNQVIEFNGFSLNAGKSGYFIVTGEVTDDNLSDLINYACAYKNDGKADNCVTKIFDIERKLNVEKSANVGNVLNGDSVEYSVKITSFGGDYSKLIVKDKLPSGVSYINNSGKVGGVPNNPKLENGYLIWTLDVGSFKKGEEIIITYSVKIADYSTETSYTNKVCVIDSYDVELGCHGITVPKGTGSVSISKYISKYYNSDWGNSLELSASDNDIVVYFKILVQGEKGKLKTFKIEDEYDTGVFELLKQADGIDDYYISSFNKELNGLSKIDLDNGKITWEVIMKDDGKFSEEDEFYVIFPMKLKSMEGGNVACIVDPLSDPKMCSNEVTFTVESDPEPKPHIPEPECGNGIQDVNEYCDLGIGGGFVENGVLFKNGGKKNNDYNGWKCTDKCELISTGNFTPSCFNVQNGSISIMEGELLPFYWNMEGMLGSHSKTERENFLKDHFYSSQAGGECNFDNVYKVDLDSMICEFIVYGPSTGQNVIYRITDVGCVGINGRGSGANNTEYYPAIKKYIEQNWDGWFDGSVTMDSKGGVYKMKNVFQTLDNGWLDNNYPTLYPYSSKLIIKDFGANEPYVYGLDKKITRVNNINAFGEFKVALNSVSYDYCNYTKSDKGKITYEMSHNKNKSRVCEVDFAVTNHYLTQESPYGAVDKKTVNGLKSYYLKNGNPLFSLEDIDKKVDDYYQIMAGIADDFDAFIKKYSRIARGNGELRQVAGSLIFVTDKGPGVGAFEIPASMLTSGKPFTLLASQGANIKIPGNIKQNIMVITTGSIIFDATNACNGAEHQKAGQVVKGIFYAGNNYHTVGDKYNTSVDNERWCNYGNLHIKGTVLGDLSSVRDNRRSELYTWFHDGCNSKSSTKCSSKRNIVIRGASVMVEFNSELLGELPPGADEFNRILQLKRN